MNAKAERIDQIIQIVNRNLLLIFAGQPEGVTPLDSRNLQRIDVNVFGGDKFAYEMVNFIKTSPKITSTSLAAQWDRNFLKGLETLIVECAVVKDEVERECFVSRVYVWFSDKLTERRDLPMHIMGKEEIKSLTDIISNVGGKHTVKALENYSASIPTAAPEEVYIVERCRYASNINTTPRAVRLNKHLGDSRSRNSRCCASPTGGYDAALTSTPLAAAGVYPAHIPLSLRGCTFVYEQPERHAWIDEL